MRQLRNRVSKPPSRLFESAASAERSTVDRVVHAFSGFEDQAEVQPRVWVAGHQRAGAFECDSGLEIMSSARLERLKIIRASRDASEPTRAMARSRRGG